MAQWTPVVVGKHYAQMLKNHGFVQGLSNPALCVQVERDVRLVVHGDDFMVEMPLTRRND